MYDKEIVQTNANDYSTFGTSTYVDDPVNSCLPGNFLDNPKVAEMGLCSEYMSQRCANNWDDKCSLYANTINDDVKQRDFFRDVAGKKYCQLSPDSDCSIMCQPFDPIAQSSVKVCKYVGSETLKDVNASVDIGWYYPVNISPAYMGSCRQICNKMNPKDIKQDDPVINSLLKYGYGNDILTNICQLAETSGASINHTGLSTFCNNLQRPNQTFSHQQLEKTQSNPVYKNPSIKKEQSDNNIWILFMIILLIIGLVWLYCRNKNYIKL